MFRIISSFGVLVSFGTEAAVLTVSNNPAIPAQYTDISAAILAAEAGDTLYLHGSPNAYSPGANIYFSVPLTFIGAGYHSMTASGLPSVAGTFNPQSGATNCVFLGLSFTSPTSGIVGATFGASVARVEFCTFMNGAPLITGNGTVVARCVFDTDYQPIIGSSCMFFNNIVVARAIWVSWTGLNCTGGGSTVIKNNLFISSDDEFAIGMCTDATIIDNIFYGARAIDSTQTVNCTINNNLTFGSSQNALPAGSNTGVNNIIGQNPLFIQVPTADLNFQYDYGLQAASPAIAAGTDGLDLGIYGGSYPITPGLVGQPLPYIAEFVITNPVIQQGGSLNVTLKARKRP